MCACVCVCERGALASSCEFLLEQDFKERFLLGAYKVCNLHISRLITLEEVTRFYKTNLSKERYDTECFSL